MLRRLLLPLILMLLALVLLGCGGAKSAETCPTPDANTQLWRDEVNGYCLLYPTGYQAEQPNPVEAVIYVGSLLDVAHPRISIEVTPADGLSTAAAVDQWVADFIPGFEVTRSAVQVGSAEGVQLDNVPGQDISRHVFVVQADRLYHLTFTPASADAGAIYTAMQETYSVIISSLTFLP